MSTSLLMLAGIGDDVALRCNVIVGISEACLTSVVEGLPDCTRHHDSQGLVLLLSGEVPRSYSRALRLIRWAWQKRVLHLRD
jgi:hypothetical protein